MIRKSAYILIAYLIVACSSQSNEASWHGWQSISSDVATAGLTGTWRNEVLGHVAVFSKNGVQLFHELDEFCIADTGVVPEFSLVRFHKQAERAQLFYYDYSDRPELLQNPLGYVRLNETPQTCVNQSEIETARLIDVFDLVWRFYDQYYAFFEERDVDWGSMRTRYRPLAAELKTDSDLFDLLSDMLSHLNDGHLNLTWEDRAFNAGRPRLRARLAQAWARTDQDVTESAFVGSWARSVQASALELLDAGTYDTGANGALEWGVIDQETGYIRINRFGGFLADPSSRQAQLTELRDTLSRAGADLQETERLIIDVSHNGGGNDAAAMTAAAHFMDTPRNMLEYAAPGAPVRRIRLTPKRTFDQKEIFLLTSEITVSSAEAFVLMMKTLPYVEHVGETTRGVMSALLPKPLPRGFRITISYQDVRDVEGRLFEGTGIPPMRAIQLFSDEDLFGSYKKEIARLAREP